MAYELKPGQGNLSQNKYRKTDNQPSHKGKVNLEGKIYDLSGWVKQGNYGEWFSLKIQPEYVKSEAHNSQSDANGKSNDIDDLIPF